MSDVGLAADPRDPRHLALRAVLEYQLGDDDAGPRTSPGYRRWPGAHRRRGQIADHVFVALATPLAGRIANDDERLDVAAAAAAGVLSLPVAQPRTGDLCHGRARADRGAASETPTPRARLHATLAAQRGTASFFVPLSLRPAARVARSHRGSDRRRARSLRTRPCVLCTGPGTGPSTPGPPPTSRTPCSCDPAPKRGQGHRASGRGARDRARARACALSSSACARPQGSPSGHGLARLEPRGDRGHG